ncbi:MAG: TonB-dependent receptor [Oleispira sp.]|nr:TonB-dependent receptor [Oleispira sp.]
MFKSAPVAFSLVFLLSASSIFAEEITHPQPSIELDTVYITGGKDEIRRLPGSATLITEEALATFEYTDIHRILNAVPGVNLQEEDGYGLRPNIGLRGTSPERSKKVTIMEDGVLSGPAPYSASAAYYFPNVSRMSAVEVFKGPATTQYGPSTIGGAINLVSRPIPYAGEGELDVQYGQYNFQRYNAHYGEQIGDFGYLIEGLNVSTDGFKDIDNSNSDTGFERNDVNLKTSWQSMGDVSQLFQLKLGYADEKSDETYLGLTRDDLDDKSNRRYASSELDNMEWDHQQFQFSHTVEFDSGLAIHSDVYYNTYQRDWFKVNSFNTDTPSIQEVLKNPDQGNNRDFYNVLTGERSSGTEAEQLKIGNNGREYISQGIQTRGNYTLELSGLEHSLELGLRYHEDQVVRHHTEQLYKMEIGGGLVAQGDIYSTRRNKSEAKALALYMKDEIRMGETTLTLGVRSEQIRGAETTYNNADGSFESKTKSDEAVILPGIGIYTQLNPNMGLLAGVHKGFSATPPGQEGDLDSEQSINYEMGMRLDASNSEYGQGEIIGFLNDYSQLTGTCSFSGGCDNSAIDSQTNAGAALVYGLEAGWQLVPEVAGFFLPASISYTFTQAEFANDFYDQNGVFGNPDNNIVEGDELAYVPEHRLNLQLGIQQDAWKVNLSALYQSEMRDTPGQGSIADSEIIDAYVVVDLSASYQIIPALQVYGTVDNVVGADYVVASQPYGYRPGKPQSVNLGMKYQF